jgi:preprotein translocase subunit YajC
MFESTTSTQEVQAQVPQKNPILGMLPLVAIFFVFYFLVIRPQSKKSKQDSQMRANLKVGDKVVMSSGIFGVIREIDSKTDTISLEVSKNVNIAVYKDSISKLLEKKNEISDKKSS